MRRWLRLVPVLLLGALAIAYVLVRPGLVARDPAVAILEFPIGALLVGLLLWAALGRRRAAPPPVWRKHEQVVRPLPDPALAPHLAALDAWVATGAAPEAAADVIARSRTSDPHEQERIRAEILPTLQASASRRKRETLLKNVVRAGV